LPSYMRHKVPVPGRWQEPLWQSESQAAEEVEDLKPGRLAESFLEPVACPPAVWVNSLPDPNKDTLFGRNP